MNTYPYQTEYGCIHIEWCSEKWQTMREPEKRRDRPYDDPWFLQNSQNRMNYRSATEHFYTDRKFANPWHLTPSEYAFIRLKRHLYLESKPT